jgi:CheY-like chemotaxis protein
MAKKRKARPRTPRKVRRARPRTRKPQPSAIEAALAGIAHDIRTPLTGILALAELLATSNLGERERQWAVAVKSGAEHLAAITTLIVDAVKGDVTGLILRNEPFSPRRLVEAVGGALTARAETKGIGAEISIARDLPAMVAGDELRLRAALENLVDNAVKFTERGAVTLAAAAEPAGARLRLVFSVSDSGIGLSKPEIARLFKPFAQASADVARRFGGTGLGLVFVRRLARAMGGDVVVSSTAGKGSTFRLSVMADPVAAPGAPLAGGARNVPRSLRILCAEDNPYGRIVMNTILTELGHRTDFVENGEAAVQAATRATYDVILMDAALPLLDGLEATRRIRALPGAAAQVPIIGISGRTEATETAARAAGMNAYFVKPVSPGKLAEALSRLA